MILIDLEQAKEVVRDSCKKIPTMAIVTMQNLEKLPVIEPRARGEWDDIGGVIRWGCPYCHHAYEVKSNFCPNCGADMREEDD